jgi:predicted dehydrogenase
VLAAIADEDEKRLSQTGKEYPGVKLLNHTSSLWDMPISAVAIATPAPTHYALAKTALSAKKDVFVEKPITLKAAEAEELAELAQKMVAYLWWGIFCFTNPL